MAENLTADFAMVDPRDLNAQKDALAKLDQTVATRMITAGAPAEALTVAQRSARSAAVASLFDRVVSDKNYLQAQALLNQWGDKIDPDVATKMKLSIDGHVAVQLGQQIGADVYSHTAAPSFSAGDATRAFNVVIGMESGGKHTDDKGKVLKDGKGMGSVGIAQLQPDTAKAMAKKLGHPEWADLAMQPTKDGEAANRLLGQAYFNELVGQFKGDIPKAMAAYNAGPAWLVGGKDRKGNKIEGALKQAAREGGTGGTTSRPRRATMWPRACGPSEPARACRPGRPRPISWPGSTRRPPTLTCAGRPTATWTSATRQTSRG
jgi:hypothetical protein